MIPIAVFALSGCSLLATPKPEELAPTVQVPVVEVVSATTPRALDVSGTIVADIDAKVAAGATGRVQSVLAQRGSPVRAGETLLVLDDRVLLGARNEAKAAVDQAEANETLATDDCRRAEALFAKGVSDDATIGRARAQCAGAKASAEAARARLAQAQARYDYTRVKAPFAGVIAERLVDPGEYVRDDSIVFTLVASEPLRLQLTVPAGDAALIREGEKVRFTADGAVGERVAYVDRLAPGLRERGRDLMVEALIDAASDDGLRPGGFVTARVEIGTQDLPVVPKEAIRHTGDLHTVFVYTAGRLDARIVEVGDPAGELVSITDGLAVGEKIASPLTDSVRDGVRIQ